jgi:hypothetical protein
MSRRLALFSLYILPFPLTAAMFFVWLRWSGDRTFSCFVLLLPLVYGYVVPGIATNILHKWRFHGPWVVGRYFAHHGFLYAAKMSPLLLVGFLGTPHAPLTIAMIVRILLCTGALVGFVYWLNDLLLVRQGIAEVDNRPAREGRSPEEIVTHYAPLCFFLIGLTYAAAALLGFQVFVILQKTDAVSVSWVSLVGIALMCSIPSLAYRAGEDG